MPMNTTSISRRRFAHLLGAGAAATAIARAYSAPAASASAKSSASNGMVRLSSNENAYGPCSKALKAMTDSFQIACRYPDEHADGLLDALAKLNNVSSDQILLGDGSGEILKLCAVAFTGPAGANSATKAGYGKLIAADPTFESILNHAQIGGAEVVKVPLTADFEHDLPAMAAAAKDGLIYICNPNNPTASITPKSKIRDFIAQVPPETIILVDEAYLHYVDSTDYETVIPLVKDHPN